MSSTRDVRVFDPQNPIFPVEMVLDVVPSHRSPVQPVLRIVVLRGGYTAYSASRLDWVREADAVYALLYRSLADRNVLCVSC